MLRGRIEAKRPHGSRVLNDNNVRVIRAARFLRDVESRSSHQGLFDVVLVCQTALLYNVCVNCLTGKMKGTNVDMTIIEGMNDFERNYNPS